MKKRISTLVLSLSVLANSSFACTNPNVASGAHLPNPVPWGMDSGPIASGFVDLKTHEYIGYHHGVDLSEYNSISYDKINDCGANFSFVKLKQNQPNGFVKHRDELHKRGINTIPYYYLNAPSNYQGNPKLFGDLNDTSKAALLKTGRDLGRAQAKLFIEDASKAFPNGLPEVNVASISGQMVALDVEDVFDKNLRPSRKQINNYGAFYAAMARAWIDSVKEKYPKAIVFFYTTPWIFYDYLTQASEEDNKFIHGLPIWIANTRPDGGDIDLNNKAVSRVCYSASAGNRCIVHQYTHRGIFAVRREPVSYDGNIVPHIDLNRFFETSVAYDAFGKQYVRAKKEVQ